MYNNKRFVLSIFWIIIGAVLLGLSIAGILESSLYAGFGGGFIAVGVLQTIKHLRYRNNSEYKEKVDTETNDERNRFLRMKSWSIAGYIMVLADGIGVIVAMVLKQGTIQMVLAYSVCFILLTYWITYLILNRKY